MSSSFGTTVERHLQPHFRLCWVLELLENQRNTSRFGEPETLTTTYSGLLKQPDNQKSANPIASMRTIAFGPRTECVLLGRGMPPSGLMSRKGVEVSLAQE